MIEYKYLFFVISFYNEMILLFRECNTFLIFVLVELRFESDDYFNLLLSIESTIGTFHFIFLGFRIRYNKFLKINKWETDLLIMSSQIFFFLDIFLLIFYHKDSFFLLIIS